MPTEADTVAAVLAAAAARHFGGPASIEKLARESGGASRQTWSFDAVVKGERHGLILRRDPPTTGKASDRSATALDRHTEFRVLAAAHKAGVRAPEPLFELRADDGLGEAYVMRRVGGTAIARKLLRDPPYEQARGKIAGQLGEILARIHAVHLRSLPPLVHREAADHVAGLRRALDTLSQPQPVFELALSWLDRRKPAPIARAAAGSWRLPHRQLSRRRIGRDRHPRLGGRASRRSRGGSRLAVRQELALRRGRQAGRRLRQPRGVVGRLRARRRRQGRSGARPLVGSAGHGALGHHLPSAGMAASRRAR